MSKQAAKPGKSAPASKGDTRFNTADARFAKLPSKKKRAAQKVEEEDSRFQLGEDDDDADLRERDCGGLPADRSLCAELSPLQRRLTSMAARVLARKPLRQAVATT